MADIRVSDVMLTPGVLVKVPVGISVQNVLRRVRTGQVALAHDGNTVVGLLEEGVLRGLVNPRDRIMKIIEHGVMPGVTNPDAPAKDVIGIMSREPSFRWFLVESAGETVGVVAPIAGTLALPGATGELSARIAQIGRLWGDPQPPREYCFCCQAPTQHCIQPAQARRLPAYPRPRCPHDGTLMRIRFPCPP
jgi:hypothetical protein